MLERVVLVACSGINFRFVRCSCIWRSWYKGGWPSVANSPCISMCRTFAAGLVVLLEGDDVPGTKYALETRLMLRFGWTRRLKIFEQDVYVPQ